LPLSEVLACRERKTVVLGGSVKRDVDIGELGKSKERR